MDAAALYDSGMSTKEVADTLGINMSAARRAIIEGGATMRPRSFLSDTGRKAIQHAGARRKGQKRTAEQRQRIKEARCAWGEAESVGFSVKPNGYIEHTRGEHKGRSVHVVRMEERIGRRLLDDEVVHHIDGDKTNNNMNNLALMTRPAHTRLHRREQRIKKEGN